MSATSKYKLLHKVLTAELLQNVHTFTYYSKQHIGYLNQKYHDEFSYEIQYEETAGPGRYLTLIHVRYIMNTEAVDIE